MAEEQLRNILTFKADRFIVPVPDDSDREPPPGRELAETLVAAIRSRGVEAKGPTADTSLAFYAIDVDIGQQAYWMMVQWVVIGPRPGVDVWAITVERRLGCLGGLFSRRSTEDDLVPCINLMKEVLATNAFGSEPRWITSNEFLAAVDGRREACPTKT